MLNIGVFDSGLGGLTVLRALRDVLPTGVLFHYLGDTARVPYGGKTRETVQRYTDEAVQFLRAKGANKIVLACNSASASALELMQNRYPDLEITGVIEPASRAAQAAHRGGLLGVVCTRSTQLSGAYERALRERPPESDRSSGALHLQTVACPLFVPLVEDGWAGTEVVRNVARRYLEQFSAAPTTLILGCTHYPLLEADLQALLPDTIIVDSAHPTANRVLESLEGVHLTNEPSLVHYYATDVGPQFVQLASNFLSDPLEHLEEIRLDN